MARAETTRRLVAEVEWYSEHFTYRSIWHAAHVLRQAADKNEINGFWSLLGATVLVYTAFEGFLNHAIEVLYPQVWAQERTFFRSPPYEGTLGKTRFLAKSVGATLKQSSRPYRTVAELHAWRNELVHPRTVRGKGTSRADAYAKKPKRVAPVAFRKLAQTSFVDRSFDDLSSLADQILQAGAKKHYAEVNEILKLGDSAFWGPTGLGGASLKR